DALRGELVQVLAVRGPVLVARGSAVLGVGVDDGVDGHGGSLLSGCPGARGRGVRVSGPECQFAAEWCGPGRGTDPPGDLSQASPRCPGAPVPRGSPGVAQGKPSGPRAPRTRFPGWASHSRRTPTLLPTEAVLERER